jgi:hypothetical protein
MSLSQLSKRLEELGATVSISSDSISLEIDDIKGKITFENGWLTAIKGFYKARQYTFDIESRVLTGNRFAEFQVVRLDPGYFYRVEHNFEGKNGDIINVSPASKEFALSYFDSEKYTLWFRRFIERQKMRSERRLGRGPLPIRAEHLFPNFHTIRFQPKRKPSKADIKVMAETPIKSCLFSLSYNRSESWEIFQDVNAKGLVYAPPNDGDETLEIPSAEYDSAAVTYYKVAKSSQFPSQIFLSYYHILEYHFLRVADENLHGAVKSQLNDPSFRADYENISKLINTLKKSDTTVDEKEMLRGVLRRFVPEADFIEFIKSKEEKAGEKLYSAGKQKVFGDSFPIKLEVGHALSNAAAILKHVRNALVHSSDRYTREDCFLPFSDSEDVIIKYIPLVEFFAERVIFSTAK